MVRATKKVENILLVGFFEASSARIIRNLGKYESAKLKATKISLTEAPEFEIDSIGADKYSLIIVSSATKTKNLDLYEGFSRGGFSGRVLILSDDKTIEGKSSSGNVWRLDVGARNIAGKVEEILGLTRSAGQLLR